MSEIEKRYNIIWRFIQTKRFRMSGLTVTHVRMVLRVTGLRMKFLRRASGPSPSTDRHLENISQYPNVPVHGEPGLRMKPELVAVSIISGMVNESTHSLFVRSIVEMNWEHDIIMLALLKTI